MASTYGFDPSCGNFHVIVRTNKTNCDDCGLIEIQHNEWVDDLYSNYYSASLPWDGKKLMVTEVESLLDEAKVPIYIQCVSAISIILQCLDNILEDKSTRFPTSIVVSVTSELVTEEEEGEEEEEAAAATIEIEDYEIKPANPKAVESLERVEISASEMKEECAMCIEDYRDDTKAIRMPCSHLFHEACIVKWLDSRPDCPLCRFALKH